MKPVLVLYYSRSGATRQMARLIARGVEEQGVETWLRTIDCAEPQDPVVTQAELEEASALALGSPTRFGGMAAPMKAFWDDTAAQWLAGSLVDKPACVFTSAASLHGGHESTLLTMMVPLLHHGMLVLGLPYTEPALHHTQSGGTPYGPSHWALEKGISADEKTLCLAMGRRLADIAKRMAP
ncbi:NAD(P)H-dependent oxidoreductase [Gallaecimonas kandeliae]|uniref:NAD(P)H-dependent oxidoreductase n=1 Tax=Gallaecimonas kandeliae TaxID=3029055 RepID=UPI00264872EC|nr:NAD(P)H-dependent oxidoreductase [Gallaecimonas kandeliae]WKE66881.1 NAD(P)H-dependent oxidoreductase [Gallaecimonas kandeliae]